MNDWNPDQYLQFKNERTQPCIDLVSRIDLNDPKTIIDFGCGPGNSTQVLVKRWPKARIIGLDNSPAMIAKAKKEYPEQEWILADASGYESEIRFDIVFSNSAIQWFPDHKALLKKFYDLLCDGGIISVQVPLFWEMPLGQIIEHTAQKPRWKSNTGKVSEMFSLHDYSFYYDQLSVLFTKLELWITSYLNILDSHSSIIEMMRSTGLRPYLDKLDTDMQRQEFETEVLNELTMAYPLQHNEKVILPFKRLFFIAYK